MTGSLFYLFLRVALGLIFVVAAVAKIASPREFSKAVVDFRIVSPRLSPGIARTIAGLELAGGVALLLGVLEWLGGVLLAGLLLAFNTAMAANLMRGRRRLDCRCFGRRTVRIGWAHVAQNTLLLVAFMPIVVRSLENPVSVEYGPTPTIVVTVLAAVYAGIAFIAAQEFINVGASLDQLFDSRPRASE
jgi:uncharacterized membrane protein YphA (DoxX/SURF4 family)